MSKILYVEDELTKNIATIRKFFQPLLKSGKIIKQLNELESQSPIYAEDIVSICNKASELDICYEFPIALNKVINNHQDYDLIIIDRNLSVYEYSDDLNEIIEYLTKAGLPDPEEKATEYHEREGDLLLLLLLRQDPENKNKVYYLTANTKDDLRGSVEIQNYMDINQFHKENIIEKGTEAEDRLSKIIADMDKFRIQNQHGKECRAIRNHLDEKEVDNYVKIIQFSEKQSTYQDALTNVRKLNETFLEKMAMLLDDNKKIYFNRYGKPDYGKIIEGFNELEYTRGIKFSSIPRNAIYSIRGICSEFGAHPSPEVTNHTITTIVSELSDLLFWFDYAMQKLKGDCIS